MATTQFKLPIGAKRQVTMPRNFMQLLALHEGSELLLEVVGDYATLTPVVSVPRTELPEDLRAKFEARRGAKPTDVPLADFLGTLQPAKQKRVRAKAATPKSAPRRSRASHA